MLESILNIIRALFSFSKEYGVFNKNTFETVSQNKYILYFIIIQFAQMLVFTYTLTQAHTRAHNEKKLIEEIANLKQIANLEHQMRNATTDVEKGDIESKLNELIKDTNELNKEITGESGDVEIK